MKNNWLREYLSRRTPNGYYVIVARIEAKQLLEKLGLDKSSFEEAGNTVIVKVRSRSLAEKILRILYKRRLLES